MSRGSRARCLGLSLGTAALALACASPAPQAPGEDVAYEVVHEAFGLRADLDGWQVYQDAEAAPAVLQRLFASKRGPDDPPLFVALRDQVVLTGLVQLDFPADSRAMYEHFAAGIGRQGEVMHAVQLPESGDILWSHRIGQGASTAYSRALLHVADGRMVHVISRFATSGSWRPPTRARGPSSISPIAGMSRS
jgi:hypothetical protein